MKCSKLYTALAFSTLLASCNHSNTNYTEISDPVKEAMSINLWDENKQIEDSIANDLAKLMEEQFKLEKMGALLIEEQLIEYMAKHEGKTELVFNEFGYFRIDKNRVYHKLPDKKVNLNTLARLDRG